MTKQKKPVRENGANSIDSFDFTALKERVLSCFDTFLGFLEVGIIKSGTFTSVTEARERSLCATIPETRLYI